MTETQQLLPFAASLGVGGILALAMFLIHRKDMQEHIEKWRGQSEILVTVVRENSTVIAKLTEKLDRVIDERSGSDRRHG